MPPKAPSTKLPKAPSQAPGISNFIDVPNLIVAPQFPVWYVPTKDDHEDDHEDEDDGDEDEDDGDEDDGDEDDGDEDEDDGDEDEDDGDDPEEIDLLPPGSSPEDEDEEFGCRAGDVSFASTVPEKDAEQVLVDFSILHLQAAAQPQQMDRYGGWRITEVNIGLLVEVKRSASRSLKDQEQSKAISARVKEACNDLVMQAAHVFNQDLDKKYVYAIAASGPYWCGTTIHRTQVLGTMHRYADKDSSYQPPKEKPTDRKLRWNQIVRVDLPSSIKRLQTIYNNLKKMDGLGTPTDV
ncbi:hypothetical protein EDD22DRAFT_853904 [Suillus occidentalis]|nr:hypothetical protein EDD22DRAFT_853904 [Suillus occidentalis]